jgi:uncharacterized protein
MVLTTVFIILGLILAVAGVLACILPVLPGPLMSYGALIVLSWTRAWEPFGVRMLVFLGALTLVFSIMDNFIPAISAKNSGATKHGIWGSVIGMVIGIFVFPPWGIFFGSFAGAVFGEMIFGKRGKEAVRIGWGVLLGSMMGIGLKLAFCLTLLFLYVFHMF